jgi:tetratricopeptide (TPR) repeat protein
MRLAAVHLAELLPPRQQLAVLAPLLSDPLRAVRIEAARAAAGQQDSLNATDRAAWRNPPTNTSQHCATRPIGQEARTALGTFYARIGRYDEAQAAFASALALDPDFVPAYLNGADALRLQPRCRRAADAAEGNRARAAQRRAPSRLGLTLVRQRQTRKACASLNAQCSWRPTIRAMPTCAVALNSTGRATATPWCA